MIEIVEYQSRWPNEFQTAGKRIRAAVGDKALANHHIGSTSVPDLAAKDVIDIQMTVSDLAVELDSALMQIGFEPTSISADHCPPGQQLSAEELLKRYFRDQNRRIHLHVRKLGAFNQRYPILFRDYLKANTSARNAYGEFKKLPTNKN